MPVSPDNSIACPIDWCTGFRDEHGGDGDDAAERGYPTDPSDWIHRSDEHELPGFGYAFWEAAGSRPAEFVVAAGDCGIRRTAGTAPQLQAIATPAGVAELARAGRLADLADRRRMLEQLTPEEQEWWPSLAAEAARLAPLDPATLDELEQLRQAGTPERIAATRAIAHAPLVAELALLAELGGDELAERSASVYLAGIASEWTAGTL